MSTRWLVIDLVKASFLTLVGSFSAILLTGEIDLNLQQFMNCDDFICSCQKNL
jgi:hypothetical protein